MKRKLSAYHAGIHRLESSVMCSDRNKKTEISPWNELAGEIFTEYTYHIEQSNKDNKWNYTLSKWKDIILTSSVAFL